MASLEEAGQREKLAQSIISKRQATEQDPVARAFATLKVLPVYLREPLSRHLSFLRKNRKPIARKAKRAGRLNATRAEPCAKYSNAWTAPTTAG